MDDGLKFAKTNLTKGKMSIKSIFRRATHKGKGIKMVAMHEL